MVLVRGRFPSLTCSLDEYQFPLLLFLVPHSQARLPSLLFVFKSWMPGADGRIAQCGEAHRAPEKTPGPRGLHNPTSHPNSCQSHHTVLIKKNKKKTLLL